MRIRNSKSKNKTVLEKIMSRPVEKKVAAGKAPVKKRAVAPPIPKKVNLGKLIEPHHIEAVKKHLPRGVANAITMRTLARRMRCSKGAAERRFNAYWKLHRKELDNRIKFTTVRDGERGPLSAGFYL